MKISKPTLRKHLFDEVYCKLGASPIHGVGVFSIREIPKNVNPFKGPAKSREMKFKRALVKNLPGSVRRVVETFCYFDDEEIYIPSSGLNALNMAIYLNHSKTPNVYYEKDGVVKALRRIKAGEELALDYDINFGETHKF